MVNSKDGYDIVGAAQFYELMSNEDRWMTYYLLNEAEITPEEIAVALEGNTENNIIEIHQSHMPLLEKHGLVEEETPGLSVSPSNSYKMRVGKYVEQFSTDEVEEKSALDGFNSGKAAEVGKLLLNPLRIKMVTALEENKQERFLYEDVVDLIGEEYPSQGINYGDRTVNEIHHKHAPLLVDLDVWDYNGEIADLGPNSYLEHNPPEHVQYAAQLELGLRD